MRTDPALAQTQMQFKFFYEEKLREIYTQLEPVRKKYLHRFYYTALICLIIFPSLYGACYYNIIPEGIYSSDGFIKLILLAVLAALYFLTLPFTQYREKTKDRVMQIILSFWGKFNYTRERELISADEIKKAELFSYFNRQEVDDVFVGQYKRTSFTVSEHNLRIHGSKGDTHIFKGVFILLNFPKKFKGKTVLLHKGRIFNMLWNNPLFLGIALAMFIPALMIPLHRGSFQWQYIFVALIFGLFPLIVVAGVLGLIYFIYRRIRPRKASQKVTLEGMPFLKHWRVLTDDQVEARYILTPSFMEKIINLNHLFRGHHVDCSFFDNKLLIAVHTRKNLFETTSLFLPALKYAKVREVISQLHSIFSVIDILDLAPSHQSISSNEINQIK